MTFGQKLHLLRKNNHLTQSTLSRLSHVPFYTIVALENNRSRVPLITTAFKIAGVFGISIEELIKDVNLDD